MNYISEKERNERFKVLKQKPDNQKCFDCGSKFPQWATVSFGLFICLDCSSTHRSFGPQISFVRSITMDNWTNAECKTMELGGNKLFKEFLKSNNMAKPEYKSDSLVKYKRGLEEKVNKILGLNSKPVEEEVQEEVVETKKEEKPVEEEKIIEKIEPKINVKIHQQEEKKVETQKKKKGLGAAKLEAPIDFNALVTDDLQLEENAPKELPSAPLSLNFTQTEKTTVPFRETDACKRIPEESLNKYGKYKAINSDMLNEQEGERIDLNKFNVGKAFGSDNLCGNEDEEPKAQKMDSGSHETPFMNFLGRAKTKLKEGAQNVMQSFSTMRN